MMSYDQVDGTMEVDLDTALSILDPKEDSDGQIKIELGEQEILVRLDENRREIYKHVRENDDISTGEIQEHIDVDLSNINRYLHELMELGLVERRRSQPWEEYGNRAYLYSEA